MPRLHTHDQHFLRSPRVVAELVGHSNLRKNDVVYDLGAGSGVIASVLARRVKQVIAVEREPNALTLLRRNLGDVENVTIINDDLLKVILPEVPYKIFANIPFSLSAKVVQRWLFGGRPPKAMYIIAQRQFARKLVASDRWFNSALGAMLWPWYGVRIRKPLKRSDFTPPPAVDTVLLEIKPLDEPLLPPEKQSAYHEFVQRCFAEQAYFAKQPKTRAGVPAERKPSELTPMQWVALYYAIKQ